MSYKEVPVREEFSDAQGRFLNYDAYDTAERVAIRRQKHTDIRSFQIPTITPPYIFNLDFESMADLNGIEVDDLDLGVEQVLEDWTIGDVSVLASHNYWTGIDIDVPANDTVTSDSVGPPVDIGEFSSTDRITIALPDFEFSNHDPDNSYVAFTSHPEGDFDEGPTDQIAFGDSVTALVNGDSEFSFPLSFLSTVDRGAITGVRFHLDNPSGSTWDFRCLAIRCVAAEWIYATTDTNTISGRLVHPVSLNGSDAGGSAPLTTWPIVWRSDEMPSSADPTPVDVRIVTAFNTGTMDNDHQFSIFLREKTLDYQTQLDLDGTLSSELDGQAQPDFGEAKYVSRLQSDLENAPTGLTQNDIDGISQFDLERKPDELAAAWIEVRVTWLAGASTFLIEIYDAETASPFYLFEPAVDNNTTYDLFIDLEGTALRLKLHERIPTEVVGPLVLDTGVIDDPEIFKRRKGRVGWTADLGDGDSYIDNIMLRGASFAEYRSHPFESLTPVTGASLRVGATEATDLFKGINSGPWGGQLFDNPERGPESFRIRNTALEPYQGIQTNPFHIDDPDHTEISFDMYVVTQALELGSMITALWNGDHLISLPLPPLIGDTWNHIHFTLSALTDRILPGEYTFVILQSLVGTPNDWLLDKLSIKRANIEWASRPYVDDAWGLNEDAWRPYRNALNQESGGVLFDERTNRFQNRAKALRQNAQIGQIYSTPKYAELGRLDWTPLPLLSDTADPTVDFDETISDFSVELVSTSVESAYPIIAHSWFFGDGAEDSGPAAVHTYAELGDYNVTLVVTDSIGECYSHTETISIV